MIESSSSRTSKSIGVLALMALAFVACSANRSSMTHSWIDPSHDQRTIKKVLVIGLADEPPRRRIFETELSRIFEDGGVAAVPSFSVMPDLKKPDDKTAAREIVLAAVTESGADAVAITRLLRVESAKRWIEGTTYVVPYEQYGNVYGAYYNTYQVMSSPDRLVEDKNYVIETKLYDVATEKLVWSGISETLNPKSAVKGIDSVGRLIVSTLRKEGVIAK